MTGKAILGALIPCLLCGVKVEGGELWKDQARE